MLAKAHAKLLYKTTTGWRKRVKDKHVEIEVSFDRLKRETFPCEYEQTSKDLTDDRRLKQETLYKTRFANNTSIEQISMMSVSAITKQTSVITRGRFLSLSPTERTPIVIELCLRSRRGLWEEYYYAPFDITHYFSSNVGFTNIVVQSTRQSGAEMK